MSKQTNAYFVVRVFVFLTALESKLHDAWFIDVAPAIKFEYILFLSNDHEKYGINDRLILGTKVEKPSILLATYVMCATSILSIYPCYVRVEILKRKFFMLKR